MASEVQEPHYRGLGHGGRPRFKRCFILGSFLFFWTEPGAAKKKVGDLCIWVTLDSQASGPISVTTTLLQEEGGNIDIDK